MGLDRKIVIHVLMTERDRLFAYIWSVVGDVHLAEDVLQEVSLLAADKAESVGDERALAAWLRTAARHKCFEAMRTRAKQPAALDAQVMDLLDAQWRAYDAIDSHDMVEALRHCLGRLTPSSRRLVEMRYAEGLKAAQIAQVLRRKATAVYQALTRVHRTLGTCVSGELAAAEARDARGGAGPGGRRDG